MSHTVNISDNLNISVIIAARNEQENVNTIIDASIVFNPEIVYIFG